MVKKIFLSFWFFFCFHFISEANFIYPIQQMSKVECRFQEFSTLWSECKMDLPILTPENYTTYKNDSSLYRRVYTVLWGSTYNYGWDVGNGWHGWVDIATAKWTPVYSISDGDVVFAGNQTGWGNVVKIRHKVNGNIIYSNYAHLSKVWVKTWDTLKIGAKIWEVWSTGNSTGNHLHFQIDLSSPYTWPWYWQNCWGYNYSTIVNTWVCFDELKKNTLDPLAFLASGWAIINNSQTPILPPVNMLTREEIMKIEVDDFLKQYSLDITSKDLGWNIWVGKRWTFEISVILKRNKKPYQWSLPYEMNFKFDSKKLDIFPVGILQIDQWKRTFQVTPKVAGRLSFDVYIWEIFIQRISLGGIENTKSAQIKSSRFYLSSKQVLWDIKKWIIIFRDQYGSQLIWVPYEGTFTLLSKDNSLSFCIKHVPDISQLGYIYNTHCSQEDFTNKVDFTYNNSFQWLLLINYKTSKVWNAILEIQNSLWEKIGTKNISGTLPKDISPMISYYDEIVHFLKNWLSSWGRSGYFQPNNSLTKEDGINILTSYLKSEANNCISQVCKNIINQKFSQLKKESNSRFEYFTRWEYIQILWKYIDISEYTKKDFVLFRDINWNLQKLVTNIFKNDTWKDEFGKNKYFQPDKIITRSEAAFLITKLHK